MRDVFRSLTDVLSDLQEGGLTRTDAEHLCLVELGLRLIETLDLRIEVADAWTLFSGYPFAQARGLVDADKALALKTARYSLWTLGRSGAWSDALDAYEALPTQLTAYTWPDRSACAERRSVAAGSTRWIEYDAVLQLAPPFAGRTPTFAGGGSYRFFAGRAPVTVQLPDMPTIAFPIHDLDGSPPNDGRPIDDISWKALVDAATAMDRVVPRERAKVLRDARLFGTASGRLARVNSFRIDKITNLLGIVGAGKSTLRDVLTYHLVKTRNLRVTIVVGDVAEVLRLVELFQTLGCPAAPIIGTSYREQHAQRLHRRITARGNANLLLHDDRAFDYLSTACAVSGLLEDDTPLDYADAPCTWLNPKRQRISRKQDLPAHTKVRHVCSFWGSCPRHHGARQLADAEVWIATPASLVDSAVPWPQNAERVRYLELAARRSDLIIVDEADRVQMQLDQMFAPAMTLAGEETTSWLDDVARHKISELVDGQRTQLSNRDVANWTAAVNTASTVTDRLYAMLVSSHKLRKWVSGSYFNAWKLQLSLAKDFFPLPAKDKPDPYLALRRELLDILEEYRKDPFGELGDTRDDVRQLVALTNQLLHANRSKLTSARIHQALQALCQGSPGIGQEPNGLTDKFELTVLLAALEPKLALMTGMWPRVQLALNLGFNQLHRRPIDYGPMVPEAPMGNILGFEFLVDAPDKGGVRSGELRFFRCSGVGRSLLTALPRITEVDRRPGAQVLLMSGSSWAAGSSRYHVLSPIDLVLKPGRRKVEQVTERSSVRLEFVWRDGRPLTLSGARLDERPHILRAMASGLAERRDDRWSPLEYELAQLEEHRRHLLVLTGSYAEARIVADTIHGTHLKGRVVRLLADDEKEPTADDSSALVLRRGDVEHLPSTTAWILVAPLLAVERGHNIMADGEAAIGTVYFLARPNPRPDDLGLAIQAINDWVTRALDDGQFTSWVSEQETIGQAGRKFRSRAYSEWFRILSRSLAWSRLSEDDRSTVTWDLLVLMWQVIGRLVRGGVEARVVLVDAAFAPGTAAALADDPRPGAEVLITAHDTARSSLLLSIHNALGRYLAEQESADTPRLHREIADALYAPFWQMIGRCLTQPTTGGKPW